MTRSRISGRMILLAVCFATCTTARSTPSLFERASTCGDSTQTQCPQSGLPAGFCCPTGSNCIALASNTTVICCPNGSTCNTILSISCDIQYQNVAIVPAAPLKTTALTTKLPTCGTLCCPFGYTCNASLDCVMNKDQSLPPSSVASTISSSSIPSNTPITILSSSAGASTTSSITRPTGTVSTTSPSATGAASNTNTTIPTTGILTESCSRFPVGAVLAGFFPGLALGIILAAAFIWFRRSKSSNNQNRPRSGSSFGNISEPHPIDGSGRIDFLRKPPMTPSSTTGSTPSRPNTMKGKVVNMFRKSGTAPSTPPNPAMAWSPNFASPIPLNIQKIGASMTTTAKPPVTPPNQRAQSPYFEDITVALDDGASSTHRTPDPRKPSGGGGGGGGGGLLRPNDKTDPRNSYMTTVSDMIGEGGGGRRRESNLAGLPKGQRKSDIYISSSCEEDERGEASPASSVSSDGQKPFGMESFLSPRFEDGDRGPFIVEIAEVRRGTSWNSSLETVMGTESERDARSIESRSHPEDSPLKGVLPSGMMGHHESSAPRPRPPPHSYSQSHPIIPPLPTRSPLRDLFDTSDSIHSRTSSDPVHIKQKWKGTSKSWLDSRDSRSRSHKGSPLSETDLESGVSADGMENAF